METQRQNDLKLIESLESELQLIPKYQEEIESLKKKVNLYMNKSFAEKDKVRGVNLYSIVQNMIKENPNTKGFLQNSEKDKG